MNALMPYGAQLQRVGGAYDWYVSDPLVSEYSWDSAQQKTTITIAQWRVAHGGVRLYKGMQSTICKATVRKDGHKEHLPLLKALVEALNRQEIEPSRVPSLISSARDWRDVRSLLGVVKY